MDGKLITPSGCRGLELKSAPPLPWWAREEVFHLVSAALGQHRTHELSWSVITNRRVAASGAWALSCSSWGWGRNLCVGVGGNSLCKIGSEKCYFNVSKWLLICNPIELKFSFDDLFILFIFKFWREYEKESLHLIISLLEPVQLWDGPPSGNSSPERSRTVLVIEPCYVSSTSQGKGWIRKIQDVSPILF